MITPLTYLRPRASLVWSVGVHLSFGAVLLGSGVLVLRAAPAAGEPVVLSMARAEEPLIFVEPQPLEELESLEVLESDEPVLVEAPTVEPAFEDPRWNEAAAERLIVRPVERRALPDRQRRDFQPQQPLLETRMESELQPVESTPEVAAGQPEVTAPEPLLDHCPPPVYPARASSRRQSGIVQLIIDVDADGLVKAVSIEVSSGHAILDHAARKAVLGWRYRPALLAGEPIAHTVAKSIEFSLTGSRR
ncbi:MAG: protein TonB [Planctomycetota bacterium]|jgi:protein TonB